MKSPVIENKVFAFNVPRKHNLKYWIQYILLVGMDCFYKLLFTTIRHSNKPKKYTLSVCSIFKNEAPYLKEWIEYYLLVGVDHFYLYNNNSEDDFMFVIQPYIDNGIVTINEWPDIPGQISAYKHWYEHYRHETNWCSFLDLDEFICPIRDTNLKQWLEKHHKYPLYAIYWKMFGTSGLLEFDKNKLVIEQYTNSWDKFASATKIIYNTDYDIECFFTSMMHKFNVRFHGFSIPPINMFGYFINHWEIHRHGGQEADIQCNHYWSKSFYEYNAKHKRGDAIWTKGESKRSMKMFLWHEHFNRSQNYIIQRFLIEMKLRVNSVKVL